MDTRDFNDGLRQQSFVIFWSTFYTTAFKSTSNRFQVNKLKHESPLKALRANEQKL